MSRKRADGQWWDETLSPLSGCTPAGAGCDNCHSIRRMKRRLPALRGKGNADVSPHTVLLHPERLAKLRGWKRPRVVLTPMLGDYFHPDVMSPFRLKVWEAFRLASKHRIVVLTKRPQHVAPFLCLLSGQWDLRCWGHVLLMASVWDQASTDAACAALSTLPAGVRWGLHCEPMLGAVDMRKTPTSRADHMPAWIVVGGENGPGARPMDIEWALDLREQCRAAGVPYWFKSMGTNYEAHKVKDERTLEQTREVPW